MRIDKTLVLYDRDSDYMKHFTDFTKHKSGLPFSVYGFSSPDALLSFSRKRKIDILLTEESEDDTLRRIPAGSVFYLCEDPPQEVSPDDRTIYRYQSGDAILHCVMEQSGCSEKRGFARSVGSARLFLVFSPLGNAGKTCFSLALSSRMNRHHPTLYLSLEESSWVPELLKPPSNHETLSELFYYYKEGDLREEQVRKAVLRREGFDCILPVQDPEDLSVMRDEDLCGFLEFLRDHAGYERIVVDTDPVISRFRPLFSLAEHVFVPVRIDAASLRKLKRFEDCCSADHFTKILVPLAENADAEGIENLSQLAGGPLGTLAAEVEENFIRKSEADYAYES